MLALHGMGERGTDNNLQLTANKMATCWAELAVQSKNPCYVIAPQCPTTSGWADNPVYSVLMNLVESTLATYNIDKDRVYITGLSMGGNGTWNAICLRPDLFAAAVPIAGWGNNAKAPVIKNIPIWAFHGQIDNTVTVDNSRFMVEAIANQGIEAIYTNCYYVDTRTMSIEKLNNNLQARSSLIYTELLGYSHNVWDYAYNDKFLFDWVFSKRRFEKNAIALSSFVNDSMVNGLISIKWQTKNPTDSVEIWFKSERQEYWKLLKKELAGKNEFSWNIDIENQCIYGKLRLCLIDSATRVYSQTESASITINLAANGLPYVKLKTPDFIKANNIMSKRIDVNYIANDVESDSVWVVFNYSANGGKTYSRIDSLKVSANKDLKTRTILFSKLPKTNQGVLKLIVYDEQKSFSADSTIAFTNQLGINPTGVQDFMSNDSFFDVKGFPNPASQTFTISFKLSEAGQLNVEIFNLTGQMVLQKEAFLNQSQQVQIPISDLNDGIYTYSVRFIPKNKPEVIRKSGKLTILH